MQVKCYWCKEKDFKDKMECEEKGTGKYNKNGTEKKLRKYFHHNCYKKYQNDKDFKQRESLEFEKLYNHLLQLHDLKILDTRMIGRVQEFRNGTVVVNGKKIKKYKEGITYKEMLESYKIAHKNIVRALPTINAQTKWNEFAYAFGIMVRTFNDLVNIKKYQEKSKLDNNPVADKIDNISDYTVPIKKDKKKDELDISEFL